MESASRMALDAAFAKTLKQVNAALAEAGAKETLVKGRGYFYFTGGESHRWRDTSVMVYSLTQLTVEQWVDEWRRLKAQSK